MLGHSERCLLMSLFSVEKPFSYCFISDICLASIRAGSFSDSLHVLGGHCIASIALSVIKPRGRNALYLYS